MDRRQFNSWQDLRDLDKPGAYLNECKSLIDQIVSFTYSEAPIYGEVSEEDVEKQDVSYRLLEEENFILKSQLLSLQDTIEDKDNKITELKTSISQLQCQIKEEESKIEEVPLPGIENVIKRISSRLTDIRDDNIMDLLRNRPMFESESSKCEIIDSMKEGDINLRATSSVNLPSLVDMNSIQDLSESIHISNIGSQNLKQNDSVQCLDSIKDSKFITLEQNYFSMKRENMILQEKIKTLTDKITTLKSSLMSCEFELAEYEKMLTIIKEERSNIVSELRKTKQSNYALKLRNEYLEDQVIKLENRTKQEQEDQLSLPSEKLQGIDEGESTQVEILNCYKNRLYEALKEMSTKEEQIEQLNYSINNLVEKFKEEKNTLEMEFAEQLRSSEDGLKNLCDEKVKLEETIRQQSKLIGHLQALIEAKERKQGSRINCLKDN